MASRKPPAGVLRQPPGIHLKAWDDQPGTVERVAVDSSAVDWVAYDKGALDIRYRRGPAYRYFGVTREEYRGLLDAESVGAYVNRRIKPFHRYARLPEP